MLVSPILTHRVSVHRQTTIDVDGMPRKVWQKVHEDIPCLFSVPSTDVDPGLDAPILDRVALEGTLIAGPKADIRPGDRLIFARPAGMGRLLVSRRSAPITGPHGISHMRYLCLWDAVVAP